MIGFLRTVGVINAALWFGGTVFFTFFVGPSFFSDPMIKLLSKPYAGAAAQIVMERYFTLHLVCGLLALGHLVAESLYLGRPILRKTLALVAAIFVLTLIGKYGLQPTLQRLHVRMYDPTTPIVQRERVGESFRLWHGVSWGLNLVVLAGVTTYLLRATRMGDNSRFRG